MRGGSNGVEPRAMGQQSGVEEGLGGLPRSRVLLSEAHRLSWPSRLSGVARPWIGLCGRIDPGFCGRTPAKANGVAWRGRRRRTGVPVDLPRPPASPATALQEGSSGRSWKTRPTLGLRCSRHGLRAAADVARLMVVDCRCGRALFTARRTVAAMTQTGIFRPRQAILLGRWACCMCLLSSTTTLQVAEPYYG